MSRPTIALAAGLLLLGFTLYHQKAISAADAPIKGQNNQKNDGQKNQKDDGQQNQNDGNTTTKKITELKTQPDKKIAELKTQPGKAPPVLKREGVLKAVPVNNNQNSNKEDGQQNQNDDGQKNQKDDGQQNQKNNGKKQEK